MRWERGAEGYKWISHRVITYYQSHRNLTPPPSDQWPVSPLTNFAPHLVSGVTGASFEPTSRVKLHRGRDPNLTSIRVSAGKPQSLKTVLYKVLLAKTVVYVGWRWASLTSRQEPAQSFRLPALNRPRINPASQQTRGLRTNNWGCCPPLLNSTQTKRKSIDPEQLFTDIFTKAD
ncbi:hypothetical protein RRG08_066261 [Elysia crispata]|uniref:Uncharacterized protein n=1 Tax=Elysia crispata TaxID=231223 RepID=A0AAE1BDQ9_9GAST|nr:hypothetical protein RRG08_066261 [Elysia crispata]